MPVLLPARAHLLLLAFSIKVMPLFHSPVGTNHPILPFQKEILEIINQLNHFHLNGFKGFLGCITMKQQILPSDLTV